MGLFNFIKKAGKSLFGASEAEAAEAAPSAEEIKKEIESHGLDADELDVKVEGDTVEVKAKAATQELREKIIIAAGNIAGVAKVQEEIAVAEEAPESTFHTVEKGDTLWAIASRHYGNGAKYSHIFEANRPMLSDPDKIYPGQVLRIPPL